MASLIIISGPHAGDYYPLGHRTTVVGRAESVPVQLLDRRVSRQHMQIFCERDSGQWRALDMRSRHGTYVEGRRIADETPLTDGDEIRVGSTKLVFTVRDFPDRECALEHYKKIGQRGKITQTGDTDSPGERLQI